MKCSEHARYLVAADVRALEDTDGTLIHLSGGNQFVGLRGTPGMEF